MSDSLSLEQAWRLLNAADKVLVFGDLASVDMFPLTDDPRHIYWLHLEWTHLQDEDVDDYESSFRRSDNSVIPFDGVTLSPINTSGNRISITPLFNLRAAGIPDDPDDGLDHYIIIGRKPGDEEDTSAYIVTGHQPDELPIEKFIRTVLYAGQEIEGEVVDGDDFVLPQPGYTEDDDRPWAHIGRCWKIPGPPEPYT